MISDSEDSCKTNNMWTMLKIQMILNYFNHVEDEAIQIFEILWRLWLFLITLIILDGPNVWKQEHI